MLRFAPTLGLLVLAGCGGESPGPTDVGRFETREAVVDPLPDTAPPPDALDASSDLQPTVDVVQYDAAADAAPDAAPVADAAAFDRPAPDLPAPPRDVPDTPCTDLAERYATAVRQAQTCATAAECATLVCETLCCTCEVYVSNVGDRARALADLRASAERMNCRAMLPCPDVRCPAPRSGVCSTEGRCVTLREAPADGG